MKKFESLEVDVNTRVICVCRASRIDFENDVNEEIALIEDNCMRLVDIKFSSTFERFTALILYKIKKF